jgi:hypothetical protein
MIYSEDSMNTIHEIEVGKISRFSRYKNLSLCELHEAFQDATDKVTEMYLNQLITIRLKGVYKENV